MENTYQSFKLLCRVLAPGYIAHSDALHLGGEIKSTNWEGVLQLADGYHVSTGLYPALKRKKCLEFLDKEVKECLEGLYQLNCLHNELLRDEALSVIRLLNSKDIQPVLLKGMAGLLSELYEDDGERLIGDVDLLVDQTELATVVKLLLESGYHGDKELCEKVFNSAFHTHELTFMTESGSVKIDLHVRPTGPSGDKAFVSTEGARAQAEVIELEDACFLLPSPLFRLMHNFYHAQYLDRSYLEGNVNLRQLVDWVKLWQRYGNEVDISEMEEKLRVHRQMRSLRLYALNAERYLEMPIPTSLKIGWVEKLLFYRQDLSLRYRWFSMGNGALNYFLYGAQLLVIPERLRLKYGDLPLLKLVGLRVAGLLDIRWYGRRLEDARKLLGFK